MNRAILSAMIVIKLKLSAVLSSLQNRWRYFRDSVLYILQCTIPLTLLKFEMIINQSPSATKVRLGIRHVYCRPGFLQAGPQWAIMDPNNQLTTGVGVDIKIIKCWSQVDQKHKMLMTSCSQA